MLAKGGGGGPNLKTRTFFSKKKFPVPDFCVEKIQCGEAAGKNFRSRAERAKEKIRGFWGAKQKTLSKSHFLVIGDKKREKTQFLVIMASRVTTFCRV